MRELMKTTMVLLALVFFQGTLAQADETATDIKFRYTITTGPSMVIPLSGDSDRTSAWGADFMYRFNPKWEIGVQLDFNFHKGFDDFEGFAVVPAMAYSVTDRLNAFIGAGVEHRRESGENEFLARFGGEYSIFLNKEESFLLLPGAFIDFVGGEAYLSVLLALGYTF